MDLVIFSVGHTYGKTFFKHRPFWFSSAGLMDRPRGKPGLAERQDEYRRAAASAAWASEKRSAAPGHAAVATAVDATLFAAVGLSGILRRRPRAGVHWPRAGTRALCWLVIGLQTAKAVRMYGSWERGPQLVYEAASVANGMLCTYKGLALTGRADGVRRVLRAAGHAFTRCSRRRPRELLRRGAALSAWLRAFAALGACTVGLWVAVDWLDSPDDPSAVSRASRAAWSTSQTVSLLGFAYCGLTFDLCLATACFALGAQFRTVSASCETAGRRPTPAAASSAGSCSAGLRRSCTSDRRARRRTLPNDPRPRCPGLCFRDESSPGRALVRFRPRYRRLVRM